MFKILRTISISKTVSISKRYLGSSYRGFNPYLCRMSEIHRIWKPLVWIDCEMTGLNHKTDRIIEICCIITDGHLNIIDENCYESVVHCDKSLLDQMDPWCVKHHGSSGLTKRSLGSNKTREQVEQELLRFIKRYIPEPRIGVLSGNSVHVDRLFMLNDFPQVVDHLHYRIVDVSSIMEVSFRHNPVLASQQPKKTEAHTAKQDILESIQQLRWYVKNYFKSPQDLPENSNGHSLDKGNAIDDLSNNKESRGEVGSKRTFQR